MGTVIRSKISTRSKWYIPKELFLELKHFCRQYRSWFKRLKEIEEPTLKTNWLVEIDLKKPHNRVMPTTEDDKRLYLNKIKAVNEALSHVEKALQPYILEAVADGKSYLYLREVEGIPCGKDKYYDEYRKFFWYLSLER